MRLAQNLACHNVETFLPALSTLLQGKQGVQGACALVSNGSRARANQLQGGANQLEKECNQLKKGANQLEKDINQL